MVEIADGIVDKSWHASQTRASSLLNNFIIVVNL